MKTIPTSEPFVRLSCRIDAADIEAMLDAYDSGMCDISTANCITRAIARQLSGDKRVRLLRLGHNRIELEVWGQRLPLCTGNSWGQVNYLKFALAKKCSEDQCS